MYRHISLVIICLTIIWPIEEPFHNNTATNVFDNNIAKI